MNTLLALWICANPANLPAVNDLNGHNKNAVSCANNLNEVIHNHSPKLYGHANRLPERVELNKGAVL